MPKLKDIEQFKASLRALGHEQETLQRWGEEQEDLPPPPQGVPGDLEALLSGGPTAAEAADDTGSAEEFSSFLDSLPLEQMPEQQSEPARPELAAEDDQFSAPEALLAGLEGDLETSAEQTAAEDAQEEIVHQGGEAESEPGGFTLPPFELPDLEAEAPAESPDQYGEPAAAEDFSLPSFDDIPQDAGALSPDSMNEPGPAGTADELAEAPSEPPSEQPLAPESFELPSFDLPDLGDLGDQAQEGLGSDNLGVEPTPAFDLPADGMELAEPAEEPLGGPPPEAPEAMGFDLGGEEAFGQTPPPDILPDLGPADFSSPTPGLDGELSALGGEPESDGHFSLDSGWGGDFAMPGFELGAENAKPAPEPEKKPTRKAARSDSRPDGVAQAGAAPTAKTVSLTDAQVDALQDTLLSYPLNLRLALEDIIANGRGSEEQQNALVWLLVEGAGAKEAAKTAGKILKRYIEVPAGFEKRSGAAFEAERGTLAYAFRHTIVPILVATLLAGLAAGLVFLVGYNLVYRPLKANSLYTEGYEAIQDRRYPESGQLFKQADDVWRMKGWYYRYARAYSDASQYGLAADKYQELLGSWPKDTQAALEYAAMESVKRQNYARAEDILTQYVLERDYFNQEALLLAVDNSMARADFEEQRYGEPDTALIQRLYEDARRRLGMVMEHHGRSDGYLERMLTYFMRVERAGAGDKSADVLPLAQYFVDNKKSAFSGATLAELGSYLMAHDKTEHVDAILRSAYERDPDVPEVHATLAAWNRRTGFPAEERKALENASRLYGQLDNAGPLSPRRVRTYLDTLIRLAEVRMGNPSEGLGAEDALGLAIDRYERALSERILNVAPEFGKAYSLLADVYYRDRGDFDSALALYDKAESHGYTTPDSDYRRGFIHYRAMPPRPDEALRFFYRAGLDTEASPYLLWATANTLVAREDYFAAQGYYAMLADTLEFDLRTISLIEPQKRPSHGELVELLTMAQNNLGATLYRIGDRMGDSRKRADAMVAFTESSKLFDSLTRDETTMIRSESKNLGTLNIDFILHPKRGIDLMWYRDLPADMSYPQP
ncbi:MAG: hypothetical protein KBB32_11505 [Spirochaetia bacterium]|nr:hypothetical protein [Spirochaetia bacterium]